MGYASKNDVVGYRDSMRRVRGVLPDSIRALLPPRLKDMLNQLYWLWYDTRDFVTEVIGWIPSHALRLIFYRHVLGIQIGKSTNIHRHCRFYCPSGISIGKYTVINRGVLLDGRMGLEIGNNVSISEQVCLFTLEHDLQSPSFEDRGAPVRLGDYGFVGARAIILPGITIGEGACIAAGAVVTGDVPPFTIVAGVPARPIGKRRQDLAYALDYHKFLG